MGLERALLTIIRYYVLSTILGFVSLTYGSVPLYKMVRPSLFNITMPF